VLGNDGDVDGDSIAALVSAGAWGSHLNPTQLQLQPERQLNGTDSFSYQANDGSPTATSQQ